MGYDNLLDDSTGLFAGATDSNLATIALLGGLGGGIGQPSGYYPSYGAPAAAPTQGRKRREAGRAVDCQENPNQAHCDRKRRAVTCDEDPKQAHCDRKRRAATCDEDAKQAHCDRKRRSDCDGDSVHPDCKRKRREVCEDNDDASCRKRRQACEACKKNP